VNEIEENEQHEHPKVWLIFLLIFSSVFLLLLAAGFLQNVPIHYQLLIGEILLALPAIAYVRSQSMDFKKVFRLHPTGRHLLLVCAVLGLSASVLIDELGRLVTSFVEIPKEYQDLFENMLVAENLSEWFVLMLASVFLASIFEEMLFRGLLLQALERRGDPSQAIMLSAVVFAMIHPPLWFIQIVVLGSLLGLISFRTRSILPCIVLHSCFNATSLFRLNAGADSFSWYNWYGHVHPTAIAVAACITFYAFRYFLQFTRQEEENTTE